MKDLAVIYSKLHREKLLGQDIDLDTFLNAYNNDPEFKSQVDQYRQSLEQQRLPSKIKAKQPVETDNILDSIPIIGDFLSDMVKYTVGGAKAGMSADESIALMKKVFGENKATDDEILEYIQAYNEIVLENMDIHFQRRLIVQVFLSRFSRVQNIIMQSSIKGILSGKVSCQKTKSHQQEEKAKYM